MIPEALFLDRDGTLIVDHEFVHKIEDLEFFPGVIEALCSLPQSTKLIIITNQAGIGRGIFTEQQYFSFRDHIHAVLKQHGVLLQQNIIALTIQQKELLLIIKNALVENQVLHSLNKHSMIFIFTQKNVGLLVI